MIASASAAAHSACGRWLAGGGTPPPVTYTSATSLRPRCDLPFIASEADLDLWLAALRTAALEEIRKGNRISL